MAGYKVTTEAANYPVDIRDVKDYLKLDDNEDEIYVRSLIASATEYVTEYTQRSLVSRTINLAIDGVPEIDLPLREGFYDGADISIREKKITLPFGNVVSVTDVKYYDENDNESVFDSSNYYIDNFSVPARLVLRNGSSWPSSLREVNGIVITYISGYGNNPKQVPEQIRLAIMQYIAFMYEHRGDFERSPPPKLPEAISVLLQPYRIFKGL